MGWSIGYDSKWKRDIGYGVPCECDHPGCKEQIDRGLSYVCGSEPYGGEHGCGLFFCEKHRSNGIEDAHGWYEVCDRCANEEPEFKPKPDVQEWVNWKLTDISWGDWREENPALVEQMKAKIRPLN